MRNTATRIVWAMLAGAMAGAGGCSNDPTQGYTTQSQYVQGVHTVAVPIWQRGKEVYRRGLEPRLTEALVKRLELDTPYKVTDRSRADTELRGSIDQVSQRVLSHNPDTGLPRETEITMTVSFTWTDLRSGKVLIQRRGFRQAGSYIQPKLPGAPDLTETPEATFSEDFLQGSEDVINRLAKQIVEQLEADW